MRRHRHIRELLLEGGDDGLTTPRSRATKHDFCFAERLLNDLYSLD